MSWSVESFVIVGGFGAPRARADAIAQHSTVLFRLAYSGATEYSPNDAANWTELPRMHVSGSDGRGGVVHVEVTRADESILNFYYTFEYPGEKELLFRGTPGGHDVFRGVVQDVANFPPLNLRLSVQVVMAEAAEGAEEDADVAGSGRGSGSGGGGGSGRGTGGSRGTGSRGTGTGGRSTGSGPRGTRGTGTTGDSGAAATTGSGRARGTGDVDIPEFTPVTDPDVLTGLADRERFFADFEPMLRECMDVVANSDDYLDRVEQLNALEAEFRTVMDNATRESDGAGGYRSSGTRSARALTTSERLRANAILDAAYEIGDVTYEPGPIWEVAYREGTPSRARLDQALAAGIIQLTPADIEAERAPRVSVVRRGRAPVWEPINIDHITPRERLPFAAMTSANIRPASSTYNNFLSRWSARSPFPMYDSDIEDFVTRHRLGGRLRPPGELATRVRRRPEVRAAARETARSTSRERRRAAIASHAAEVVGVLIGRIMAIYRLRAYHAVAERMREDHRAMLARTEEIGTIRSLWFDNVFQRAEEVFTLLPQEADLGLIGQYSTAFGTWYDRTYANAPGGWAEEYARIIASRDAADMLRMQERNVEERARLREFLSWIGDRLENRARVLEAAESFRRLHEFYGDVTSEEVNDLAIDFDDWLVLVDHSERLANTLENYVRVLTEIRDRVDEALTVIALRYSELDRAMSAVYAAGGGYVD